MKWPHWLKHDWPPWSDPFPGQKVWRVSGRKDSAHIQERTCQTCNKVELRVAS